MNSNLKAQEVVKVDEVEEETKQSKTFTQDVFKIDYSNTSKIVYQQQSHSPDVKVNNYLCCQEGQNLRKITEIIYEDKLIRIEDNFEVCLDPASMNQWASPLEQKCDQEDKKSSRNFQKVRMFNKSTSKQSKAEKRDKKNIVKNVVKIFYSWLEKNTDETGQPQQEAALGQLQNLLGKENYNNRLIKKMIENQKISKQFAKFLEDSAYNQIKYSRIQDKESHYQALQIYKNLLSGHDPKNSSQPHSSSEGEEQNDPKFPHQASSNIKINQSTENGKQVSGISADNFIIK